MQDNFPGYVEIKSGGGDPSIHTYAFMQDNKPVEKHKNDKNLTDALMAEGFTVIA